MVTGAGIRAILEPKSGTMPSLELTTLMSGDTGQRMINGMTLQNQRQRVIRCLQVTARPKPMDRVLAHLLLPLKANQSIGNKDNKNNKVGIP